MRGERWEMCVSIREERLGIGKDTECWEVCTWGQ